MAASNGQVTDWVNVRTRPFSEDARSLLLQSEDNAASIDEVYANLSGTPDWVETRQDVPANLSPGEVLNINAWGQAFANICRNGGTSGSMSDADRIAACKVIGDQLPIILKACVRPVE